MKISLTAALIGTLSIPIVMLMVVGTERVQDSSGAVWVRPEFAVAAHRLWVGNAPEPAPETEPGDQPPGSGEIEAGPDDGEVDPWDIARLGVVRNATPGGDVERDRRARGKRSGKKHDADRVDRGARKKGKNRLKARGRGRRGEGSAPGQAGARGRRAEDPSPSPTTRPAGDGPRA